MYHILPSDYGRILRRDGILRERIGSLREYSEGENQFIVGKIETFALLVRSIGGDGLETYCIIDMAVFGV